MQIYKTFLFVRGLSLFSSLVGKSVGKILARPADSGAAKKSSEMRNIE